VNPVKEACFIKLEFLWEGWLIQNISFIFAALLGEGL